MRIKTGKKLVMLMVFTLSILVFGTGSTGIAQAATPKFTKSKIELTGEGATYELTIKNKVSGSKYSWTSSDKKVVKVSSKGVLTSVGGGSTTVKCKITYPAKTTKTLSCKVIVTIPAKNIQISNAAEISGAHTLQLGASYQFKAALSPTNSTDKIYWSVGCGDKECIRIDNAEDGKVTATKAGFVTLVATAADTASEETAKKSLIRDEVIIQVTGTSASVKSADIISSTAIQIVFDSPIDKSTVIDSANKLTGNIKLSLLPNSKKVYAADPGALTPSLSADLMTLTLTSKDMFDGSYGIEFSDGIKTTGGTVIKEWYKTLTYKDTTAPVITGVTVDDSGYVNTISFSEAIDVTNFKASNAAVMNGKTVESDTLTVINNELNYVLSEDKKSLMINLSTISSIDYNKTFSVILSGIADLSGNVPGTAYYTTYVRTDTTAKVQAFPLSVVRTSYKVLTATFNRAIQSPGYLKVNGHNIITGIVDDKNNKKVHYTISDSDALLTGNITVFLSEWNSYNVVSTDYSALTGRTFTVNFMSDSTSPVMTGYEYDAVNNYLTLSYSKAVYLTSSSGVIVTSIKTVSDEIMSGTNISYTDATVSGDDKTIRLKLSNMTLLGTYTFTLNSGFVTDGFRNKCTSRTLSISNTSDTSNELPAPYAIAQSSENLSLITIDFANKIDVASAETVRNYSITGVAVLSATVTKNTSNNGATVQLTLADDSIDVTVQRPIAIKGIMGYKGSYSAMADYTTTITLKENKRPYYKSLAYDKASYDVLKMYFSEEIKGTLTVQVTAVSNGMVIGNTVSISGNTASITLDSIPANGTYLKVQILSNGLTDLDGNSIAGMNTTYGVLVSY